MTTEQAYAHCRRLTREAATTFYQGIRLLPRAKRQALWAVYAFCRTCDDAVDDHAPAEAALLLERARRLQERALAPGFERDADPVVVALGDAVRRFALPAEALEALLQGMAMDLARSTYETFADLLLYCQRVAGSVGLLCLHVFGFRGAEAPELAVEMGVALQLTNILRDLKEDVGRGRIYLPRTEMEAAGYSADDLRAQRRTPAFLRLMRQQAERAQEYFRRAEALFPLVAPDARLCPMALHAVYRELLACIEASGFDVFGGRLRVPLARKLQLIGGLLLRQRREAAGRA